MKQLVMLLGIFLPLFLIANFAFKLQGTGLTVTFVALLVISYLGSKYLLNKKG